jgi:acyl-CoA thioesterase-1
MSARKRVAAWLCVSAAIAGCGASESTGTARERGRPPESLDRPEEEPEGTGEVASPDIPADAPLVVFLGDSITAGLHVDPRDAFPAVAQRLLAADAPFRLVNAGVSGDTSAGGLRRLDWLLEQDPDVLVLELGGNDGLRGQPVGEVEARLGRIVERSRAAEVDVLLLGVRLPPSLGADYAREFEAMYARLAAACSGCGFVPSFMEGAGGVPGMMRPDGLHPTRAGHERIAANVAPALRGLLAEHARR